MFPHNTMGRWKQGSIPQQQKEPVGRRKKGEAKKEMGKVKEAMRTAG